ARDARETARAEDGAYTPGFGPAARLGRATPHARARRAPAGRDSEDAGSRAASPQAFTKKALPLPTRPEMRHSTPTRSLRSARDAPRVKGRSTSRRRFR